MPFYSYANRVRVMKKIVSVFAVLILAFGLAANAFAGEAQDHLKAGIDKVIVILSDHALKGPAKKAERQAKLRAVAEHWSKYSPKQQDEFVVVFSELLQKTYIRKLEKYNNEKVSYLKEQISGNQAFINTQVMMKDKTIPINYIMIKHEQWMVYDVVVEGVSLVKNYRSQFAKILTKESPEALIQRIKDKIKALDEGKNVDDAVGKG
jgi:phospholipid transport system substrate-binding protein